MRVNISVRCETSSKVVSFELHPDSDDRNEAEDGALLAGNRIATILPEAWEEERTHPDLIGLAVLVSVQPWVQRELVLDRGVSAHFAQAVEQSLGIAVGPVDASIAARSIECGTGTPAIAFSGGVDSTALAVLLPEANLYFLHRAEPGDGKAKTKYRSEAALASCADMEDAERLVRRIVSDIEYVRNPVGAPVHGPAELSFALPAVLMADADGIDALGVGVEITEAYRLAYGGFAEIGQRHALARWAAVLEAVGLGSVNAVAGLSEYVTTRIALQSRESGVLVQSCLRGSAGEPCGHCWKCFRKAVIQAAVTGEWPSDDWFAEALRGDDITSRLLQVPILNEASLLHGLQRYEGGDPVLRLLRDRLHVLGDDFSHWTRYYGPALDLVAPPYRDRVRDRLERYAAPMSPKEEAALRSWRPREHRYSYTARKQRDRLADVLAAHDGKVRLAPRDAPRGRGKPSAYPRPHRGGAADAVGIRRNDHTLLDPPRLGEWEPELSVSVVIPAHGGQEKLDLVLAALAAQTYPSELTEVVVVDDHSEPKLELAEIRPPNTRIIRNHTSFQGSTNAVNLGALHSDGDVILRMDSDMVACDGHIESQLRWHHLIDNAAVIGQKKFVSYRPGSLHPEQVYGHVRDGHIGSLFGDGFLGWYEELFDKTERLVKAPFADAYRCFVGATGSMRRTLFETAGGLDESLLLGGDTEFAYRLGLAGAVFIPDHGEAGESWHLGIPQMRTNPDSGGKYRRPLVMQRVPDTKSRRALPGTHWEVPYVDVVIDTRGFGSETIIECVTPLLAGTTADIRVNLIGDWPERDSDQHLSIDHPDLDAQVVRETYRSDDRVRLLRQAPVASPSVPWRLIVPCATVPTKSIIENLVELAQNGPKGLVTVDLPGGGQIRLEWRPAFARAAWHGATGEALDRNVKDLFGVHRLQALYKAVRMQGYVQATSEDLDRWVAPVNKLEMRTESSRLELERTRADLDRLRERTEKLECALAERHRPSPVRRALRRLLRR